MRFLLATCLLTTGLLACGDHDHDEDAEPFDTFQDCFVDHHDEESLSVNDAIVICCLDHPIDGVTEVCGATAATCETYLGTNLDASSATSAEVTAACDDYATQKDL